MNSGMLEISQKNSKWPNYVGINSVAHTIMTIKSKLKCLGCSLVYLIYS
jgi:hypothetical protein